MSANIGGPAELIGQQSLDAATNAEWFLLGAIMHSPAEMDVVAALLSPSNFLSKSHAQWYACISRFSEQSSLIDVFTVSEDLDRTVPRKDGVSWLAVIGSAMQETYATANIKHYAQLVKRFSDDRRAALAGGKIVDVLGNRNLPRGDRLCQAEDILSGLNDAQSENEGIVTIGEALSRSVDRVEMMFGRDDNEKVLLPYGIDHLDEMTMGAHRGDVIYIAGRPAMGKTALAMRVAESLCSGGSAGLVFSMEMSPEQLAGRMVTGVGRIDAERYRSGRLLDDDWCRMTTAIGKVSEFDLSIDEKPSVSPGHIRRAARRKKRDGKLDFIIVDYLQMMSVDNKPRSSNRVEEITEISRQLKLIAKELDIAVIVLSQLNRNLEQRADKRPVMSDLRESGAIEQDADLILFIYRDEIYNKDSQAKGVAEIIIGKQRNGPIGMVPVAFIGAYSRFENLSGSGC